MSEKKIQTVKYYNVKFGKIVREVDKDTEGAVLRTNQRGRAIYEIICDEIDGELIDVKFRKHPEFGNFWDIILMDKIKQVITLKQGAYSRDFLKKLPNLNMYDFISIKPYDYVKDNKRKIGLRIYKNVLGGGISADDVSKFSQRVEIQSYYQIFEKKNDVWVVKNINGYPDFQGDPNKEEEVEIHYKRVEIFLRERALEYLKNMFVHGEDRI